MEQLPDLSDSQLVCLDLVGRGVTSSKAIAAKTGLSPSSIDNYLQRAAKALGVDNRMAAAARFAELMRAERSSVSRSVSRSRRLVRPIRIVFDAIAAGVRWLFAVPPVGGRKHSLNRIEISILILKIAGLSVICFCSIALVLSGVLWALS